MVQSTLTDSTHPDDELTRLAAAGQRIVSDRTEKEAKKHAMSRAAAITYRRKADRARVALHLTRWSVMTDGIIAYSMTTLFAFATAMIVTLVAGEASVGIVSASLAAALGIVLVPLARARVRRALRREKTWIEGHPFEVTCYPDILVYRSYPSAWLTLEFEDEAPPRELVLNILSGYGLAVVAEPTDEKPYRFELKKKGASKFDGKRRWLVRWVHEALDGALTTLHGKYPISRVEFGSGNRELDSAWWQM